MHQNSYWLVFLSLIALSILGYTIWTGIQLYEYYRLSIQVPITAIKWTVKGLSEEEFAPQAHYQFIFEGKSYQGQTTWQEHYLNPWAAEEAIGRLTKEQKNVWIDPHHLNVSTLQKKFPFKQCISMVILWLLLIYFIGLGRYVKNMHKTERNYAPTYRIRKPND